MSDELLQFIIKHWQQWTLLLIILTLILWNEFKAKQTAAKTLTPQALVHLINNNEEKIILIDLRDQETFRKGHLLHAINAQVSEFEHNKMDKYKDKILTLLCENGFQSAQLANKLKKSGFINVSALKGGMAAWKASNLPLIKGK